MNEEVKQSMLTIGTFAALLFVFVAFYFLTKKFSKSSTEVAANLHKNALKGDELSLEVRKNAWIISRQYLLGLLQIEVISLYLYSLLLEFWKTHVIQGTGISLIRILVLLVGAAALARQAFRVKSLAAEFHFPIVNIKNYVLAFGFGIFFLGLSLSRPETSDMGDFALNLLMGLLIPTILFDSFCQQWVLSAYGDVDPDPKSGAGEQ